MNVYFYISTTTMLSFPSGFKKTDAMFLEFGEDLNTTEGLSSVGNNSSESLDTLIHNYFNLFLYDFLFY